MAKAIIEGYGMVDFDPLDYDHNAYEVYCVAICDPDTNEVMSEEHYVGEDDYQLAVDTTYGRECVNEGIVDGCVSVTYNGEQYECKAIHHIAYVIDHDG